jgi:hypothetical protein
MHLCLKIQRYGQKYTTASAAVSMRHVVHSQCRDTLLQLLAGNMHRLVPTNQYYLACFAPRYAFSKKRVLVVGTLNESLRAGSLTKFWALSKTHQLLGSNMYTSERNTSSQHFCLLSRFQKARSENLTNLTRIFRIFPDSRRVRSFGHCKRCSCSHARRGFSSDLDVHPSMQAPNQ